MKWLLLLSTIAVCLSTMATASELTASDVRELLASVGVSPGTSKKLANGLGTQMLTSVDVKKVGNGEFIITVRVKKFRRLELRDLIISAISGFIGGYIGVWVTMLVLAWIWPRGIVRDGS